jgi:hypothetical protein
LIHAAAFISPVQQVYWPLVLVVVLVGSSSSVGSMGAAAAVEREWVKVLCGPDLLLLARTNSGGGRIGRLPATRLPSQMPPALASLSPTKFDSSPLRTLRPNPTSPHPAPPPQ